MGLLSGGGFLGSIGGALGINTSAQEKAIGRAGQASQASIKKGIKGIRGAQRATLAELQPFAQAGLDVLPGVQQSATLEGFGGNLDAILNSGALDPFISQRQRAADASFGRAGLTRSGAAGQAAADIPAELALQFEALLSGRQNSLLNTGLNASSNLASIRQGNAANIANLQVGQGQAQSSTILGQQQAQQAGQSNLLQLGFLGLGAANAGLFGGLGGGGAAALGGGSGIASFNAAGFA